MNTTEANHVNQLLRWLLDLPGEVTGRLPDVEVAHAAARALADRANKALMTGISGADVDGAWHVLVAGRAAGEDPHDPGPVPDHDPADTRPLLARQLEHLRGWADSLTDPNVYRVAPEAQVVSLARVLTHLVGAVQQLHDEPTTAKLEVPRG